LSIDINEAYFDNFVNGYMRIARLDDRLRHVKGDKEMSQAYRHPGTRPSARATVRAVALLVAASCAGAAFAQEFNWKKHQGKTVANALLKHKADFEQQTGMTLKVDSYQEQQMRQRLVTVMNSRSDEVDVFMSLPSREGMQFAKAGWYADLSELVKTASAKDYDFADLSAGML
jgi:multiple sugar transport system substrate-binding protein